MPEQRQAGSSAALGFFFAFCPTGVCDGIKGSRRCGLFLIVAGEELYLQCDKGETLLGGKQSKLVPLLCHSA